MQRLRERAGMLIFGEPFADDVDGLGRFRNRLRQLG